MEKAFASVLAPASPTRKAAARAALVGLKDSTRTLLADCFRQFGIETVVMSSNAAERLHKEKFEAFVVSLDGDAEAAMNAARTPGTRDSRTIAIFSDSVKRFRVPRGPRE